MLQRMLFTMNGYLSPILGAEPGAEFPAEPLAEGAGQVANAAPTGGGGFDVWWIYGVWILVILGFYFLTIRPQRKRDKQMREMQAGISVGDNVVVTSGMYGRVAEIGHDCFVIEFGTNRGVRIPIRKTDVLGKSTPQFTVPPDDKE